MERQEIEKKIARRIIADALEAGFSIAVFDGEEFCLEQSTDANAIIMAMFSTDDDRLYFFRDGAMIGYVWLIYGNSGWDVISDYTMTLDDMLRGAIKLSEELEERDV